MLTSLQKRNEAVLGLVDEFITYPTGDEPIGTLFIPQLKRGFDGFTSWIYNSFSVIGQVTTPDVVIIADALSRKVGKRYSVVTMQRAYEEIFGCSDPRNQPNPVLGTILTDRCDAPVREIIDDYGRKVIPDPVINVVDGEYRISGRSENLFGKDCLDMLVRAGVLKENISVASRNRPIKSKQSYLITYFDDGRFDFTVVGLPKEADPHTVAILMRARDRVD